MQNQIHECNKNSSLYYIFVRNIIHLFTWAKKIVQVSAESPIKSVAVPLKSHMQSFSIFHKLLLVEWSLGKLVPPNKA